MSLQPEKDYRDGGSSHLPTTEEELDEEFNDFLNDEMVKLRKGTIITVNEDKYTCTVHMNGMPHEDVTWALPFYNVEDGTGIDFIPSTEHGEGRQVLVAIDKENNKFIIGALPRAKRDNESPHEDYSTGRDTSMEGNDVSIKVDDTHNTGFFAKAKGLVEMIVNPNLKIVANQAKKLMKIATDNLKFATPATNLDAEIDSDGMAKLKLKQKANESQGDGGEMLNLIVGRDVLEGQLQPKTTLNLYDTLSAPNNSLEVNSSSYIEVGTLENIELSAFGGITLDGGVGQPESAVLGETLKEKLEEIIDLIKNHNHTYMDKTSGGPVPSQTTQVVPQTITQLEQKKVELQQILSQNVENN